MTVDIFERVGLVVGGRHQLDDSEGCVVGDSGNLVESLPPSEILLQITDHSGHEAFDAFTLDPSGHISDVDELRHFRLLVQFVGVER